MSFISRYIALGELKEELLLSFCKERIFPLWQMIVNKTVIGQEVGLICGKWFRVDKKIIQAR